MKILCVAEKNSIASAVAGVLSGGTSRKRDSPSKYVKIYEFTFNFPQWGQCDVIMTAVAGHLTELDLPQGYGWNECPPEALFSAPLIRLVPKKNKAVANNITNLARNCNQLMIWTDCDREGEHIGYEIVEQAKKGNSFFNLDTTYRAKFSHLEHAHIVRAACNPIRLDKNAIDAVNTRTELDIRTGFCFTRYLTNTFKPLLGNDSSVVSYGNCQFPTLGFVVDRFKRIKNFKTESFWYIAMTIKKGNKKCTVSWERANLFDRLTALCIFQNCLNIDNDNVTVTSIETKPTSNRAPLPLTTVELQKDCSRYFKLSAKQALAAAEKLYQKGLVSYPRTETDKFPQAMEFNKLIEKQTQSGIWGSYAFTLINDSSKFRTPREGYHDDKAHPPIHPVGYAENLTGDEKRVFEYIVRRFLACCSQDATGSLTSLRVKWGTEYFGSSGLTVNERNFLEIYTFYKWESSRKELPIVQQYEKLLIDKVELSVGKTTPPSKLTETELIALMDANGIGTDATIADHIEKIADREYIIKEKGAGARSQAFLVPTELGFSLVEGFNEMKLDNISLTKPFLRKDMEENLTSICDGRVSQRQVLQRTLEVYHEAFNITRSKTRLLTNTYKRIVSDNNE